MSKNVFHLPLSLVEIELKSKQAITADIFSHLYARSENYIIDLPLHSPF